ncbi:MAG: hypothetical protein MJE77_14515 [Proteobacteria bacterium]|nr:hypothetical protein [Pseudomonadota bacterium]
MKRIQFYPASWAGIVCFTLLFPATGCRQSSIKPTVDKTRSKYYLSDEEIDPDYGKTDIASLITIGSAGELQDRRRQLIGFIWKGGPFPGEKLPARVVEKHLDERYKGLPNLRQIDRLTVTMDWGVNSIIYYFRPIERNNRLFIYHQGHTGDFIVGKAVIAKLVASGYAVLGLAMPLVGMNNRPVHDFEHLGRHQLTKHSRFVLVESAEFSAIRFFAEPVAVALNHALATAEYDSVAMTGISGGGWTTTLYAALDPRVERSYPVAGTLPFYLRSKRHRNTWGDFEQNLPALYRIANYLELYLMGSSGQGRAQLQILNKYDSCCFSGISYQTYHHIIQWRAERLGGSFDVFLDDSHHEHKISERALAAILSSESRFR